MSSNNNPERPSWKLCALLMGLPIITFATCEWAPPRSLNNSCAAVVWLVYVLIAIGLESLPVAFMLIGMFVGGSLSPVTSGQPGEVILKESGTAIQFGFMGFVLGCIPSLFAAMCTWIAGLVLNDKKCHEIAEVPQKSHTA